MGEEHPVESLAASLIVAGHKIRDIAQDTRTQAEAQSGIMAEYAFHNVTRPEWDEVLKLAETMAQRSEKEVEFVHAGRLLLALAIFGPDEKFQEKAAKTWADLQIQCIYEKEFPPLNFLNLLGVAYMRMPSSWPICKKAKQYFDSVINANALDDPYPLERLHVPEPPFPSN